MNLKTCSLCKVELALDAFNKRPGAKFGVQTVCKECHKAYARKHYLANKEKRAAQVSAWKVANPEIVKECARKQQAKRRAVAPEVVNAENAARKSYIKRATPLWAEKFFIAEAYHIAKVREKTFGFKWHVDHVIPLRGKNVCGLHVHNNLQVIPAQINLKKHASFQPM
jgi:hypothetical protein